MLSQQHKLYATRPNPLHSLSGLGIILLAISLIALGMFNLGRYQAARDFAKVQGDCSAFYQRR